MIDLHTHSLYSDGELIPAELWRRAQVKGYRYLAITDHVDASNFEVVFTRLKSAALSLNRGDYPVLIPGLEFTHLPPALIAPLTAQARALGVPLIVVHGESLAEPVAPGTNRAAIEADIDILAHPGLITLEEAARARERNIFLELSARKGHSPGQRPRGPGGPGGGRLPHPQHRRPRPLGPHHPAPGGTHRPRRRLTGRRSPNPLRRRRSPGPPPGGAVEERGKKKNLGEPRFFSKARFPQTPSWKNGPVGCARRTLHWLFPAKKLDSLLICILILINY